MPSRIVELVPCVLDDEEGRPPPRARGIQEREHARPVLRVYVRERFVEDADNGANRERLAQRQERPASGAQRGDPLARPEPLHGLANLLRENGTVRCGHPDGFRDVEVVEAPPCLVEVADLSARQGAHERLRVGTSEPNLPREESRRCSEEPAQEARLAGPIAPLDEDGLAGTKRERGTGDSGARVTRARIAKLEDDGGFFRSGLGRASWRGRGRTRTERFGGPARVRHRYLEVERQRVDLRSMLGEENGGARLPDRGEEVERDLHADSVHPGQGLPVSLRPVPAAARLTDPASGPTKPPRQRRSWVFPDPFAPLTRTA